MFGMMDYVNINIYYNLTVSPLFVYVELEKHVHTAFCDATSHFQNFELIETYKTYKINTGQQHFFMKASSPPLLVKYD